MKRKLSAVLLVALATSIFTIGYSNPVSAELKANYKQRIVTNKPIPGKKPAQKPTATQPAPPQKVAVAKPSTIKQPVSEKFMETPKPTDFEPVIKADYHLSVPTAFGVNPLADLPGTDGPMTLRVQDNLVFMAVNVIDPEDDESFNATQTLPQFEGKKTRLNWLQGTQGKLKVQGSRYDSIDGSTYVIEGKYENKEKIYELLYSFPKGQMKTYLPLVLYSLNSFQMN